MDASWPRMWAPSSRPVGLLRHQLDHSLLVLHGPAVGGAAVVLDGGHNVGARRPRLPSPPPPSMPTAAICGVREDCERHGGVSRGRGPVGCSRLWATTRASRLATCLSWWRWQCRQGRRSRPRASPPLERTRWSGSTSRRSVSAKVESCPHVQRVRVGNPAGGQQDDVRLGRTSRPVARAKHDCYLPSPLTSTPVTEAVRTQVHRARRRLAKAGGRSPSIAAQEASGPVHLVDVGANAGENRGEFGGDVAAATTTTALGSPSMRMTVSEVCTCGRSTPGNVG